MESCVINRIRRHLLLLAIFYHGKSWKVYCHCNKSYRIRRHLLLLDIFSHYKKLLLDIMEIFVTNRIRRHLLSLAIFSHRKLCNKSY